MRASVSRSASMIERAPVCTATATDAVTSPWVRMRRRKYARSVATSTTSPLVTASSTPPECTWPPVGRRESAIVSSVAKPVI